MTAVWTLRCVEIEGSFPIYRDVIPESGSRFAADPRALIDAVREVSLATGTEARALHLELWPRSVRLSAASPDVGQSSATMMP